MACFYYFFLFQLTLFLILFSYYLAMECKIGEMAAYLNLFRNSMNTLYKMNNVSLIKYRTYYSLYISGVLNNIHVYQQGNSFIINGNIL